MSFGKKSPPPPPNFANAAISTSNASRYNTSGPWGQTGWQMRPGADANHPLPGDFTQATVLDPHQQALLDQSDANKYSAGLAAKADLSQLGAGQKAYQDAVYNNETRYYDKRFGNDQAALESRLTSQGVTPGSAAWDNAMQGFQQNKNDAYRTASNDAILGGATERNQAVSQIMQLMAGSQPTVPTAPGAGTSADLLQALQQSYGAQVGNTNAANASIGSTFGSLASALAMYIAMA